MTTRQTPQEHPEEQSNITAYLVISGTPQTVQELHDATREPSTSDEELQALRDRELSRDEKPQGLLIGYRLRQPIDARKLVETLARRFPEVTIAAHVFTRTPDASGAISRTSGEQILEPWREVAYVEAAAELVRHVDAAEGVGPNTDIDKRVDVKTYLTFLHDIFGLRTAMDVLPTYRDLAYLRQHGEWFENPGLYGYRRGQPKQCYVNARDTAERNLDLTYVQGLMTGPGGLVYGHAWCVDREGRMVELTLDCDDVDGYRFFGVRFSSGQLGTLGLEYRTYDWYEGFSRVIALDRPPYERGDV